MAHINNRLAIVALVAILATSALAACSTTGNIDTPEKQYLVARSELNLLLQSYLDLQDSLSDTAHAKARTAFSAADKALDA